MRVGVVGAGQLARMTHQAAISLGVEVRYLASGEDDPAAEVARFSAVGDPRDPADLRAFAAGCDVVTFEHELVDLEVLAGLERLGVRLRPSSATLRMVADKAVMRGALAAAGLPVPPFRVVGRPAELDPAVDELGPVVAVKWARGGYDGRGVFRAEGPEEARRVAAPALDRGLAVVVEPWLALARELAVLAVRRPGGEVVCYDPVVSVQQEGMCREVLAPAPVAAATMERARRLGLAASAAVEAVGVLAVEIFELADGELAVNELAARPHNSGHHTIEATATSQFENHLRAVLDLPLGAPDARVPAAAMVNVIGADDLTDPRHRLTEGLAADPGAAIHLYGKTPRAGRKLGHVTVCDHNVDSARARARRVAAALGGA